jgi:hypothetical protein
MIPWRREPLAPQRQLELAIDDGGRRQGESEARKAKAHEMILIR